jgi:hypothetical protein
MKDKICVVEVGIHPPPYFKDKKSGLVVCSRHKFQYDEYKPGEFDWEDYDV